VLLIDAPEEIRVQRLMQREKINADQAKKRIAFSGSTQSKKETLEKIIERDRFGTVISFANHDPSENEIENLSQKILQLFAS
jgi:dephospho-CoA kinase